MQQSKKQCNGKAADGGEGGEARASTGTHTGSTLHIGGGCRGAEAGAAGGGNSVGHENFVDAVDVALFVNHAGFLRDANHGAHSVEHVDEEEGEEDDEHVKREDFAPLELAEDGCHRGRDVDHAVKDGEGSVGHSAVGSGDLPDGQHAQQGGDDDADEDVAGHLEDEQHTCDDDADDGQQGGAVADVAEVDQRGFVVDDDAAVLQADEGDEQADTGTNGVAQIHGNGIHNPLTHLGEGEDDEDDTFK